VDKIRHFELHTDRVVNLQAGKLIEATQTPGKAPASMRLGASVDEDEKRELSNIQLA